MKNILESTSQAVDQVTIEPDGRWSDKVATSSPSGVKGVRNDQDDDEDDDLLEIRSSRVNELRNGAPTRPPSATGSYASPHIAETMPSKPTGQKRSQEQVIDLTGSDDESQTPLSAKRPRMSLNVVKNGALPSNNGVGGGGEITDRSSQPTNGVHFTLPYQHPSRSHQGPNVNGSVVATTPSSS